MDDRYSEIFVEYFAFIDPILQRAGFKIEVLGASCFDMAIRLLQEGSFDLIISDYDLGGGGTGVDLIRRVRAGEFLEGKIGTPSNVPAIGMSGYFNEALLRHGFDHSLARTITPKTLVKAIFSILKIGSMPIWFVHRTSNSVVFLEIDTKEIRFCADSSTCPGLFDVQSPATLSVDGARLATFTVVTNEHLVIPTTTANKIKTQINTGEVLVVEYLSILDGGKQSATFDLASIRAELSD